MRRCWRLFGGMLRFWCVAGSYSRRVRNRGCGALREIDEANVRLCHSGRAATWEAARLCYLSRIPVKMDSHFLDSIHSNDEILIGVLDTIQSTLGFSISLTRSISIPFHGKDIT